MKLHFDWITVMTVEGGSIEAKRRDEDTICVSFPDDVHEAELREIFCDRGIELGSNAIFEAGESEGETVGFFS